MSSLGEEELRDLLRRAAKADDQAITQLWRFYYPRLKLTVLRRIATMPRLAGEASDLASSALQGFLGQLNNSPELDITDMNSAWGLLKVVAMRHINDVAKSRFARKRGGRIVTVSLDQPRSGSAADGSHDGHQSSLAHQLADNRTGSPSDQLLLDDLLEQLLARLHDQQAQQIILLRLENRSTAEIAELLKVSTRTVQRQLKEVDRMWSDQNEDPTGTGGPA